MAGREKTGPMKHTLVGLKHIVASLFLQDFNILNSQYIFASVFPDSQVIRVRCFLGMYSALQTLGVHYNDHCHCLSSRFLTSDSRAMPCLKLCNILPPRLRRQCFICSSCLYCLTLRSFSSL